MDAIIIQILKIDNISENYFLIPNLFHINKHQELINKKIYILQFPVMDKFLYKIELSRSEGNISKIMNIQMKFFIIAVHQVDLLGVLY